MKKLFSIFVVLMWILIACAPQTQTTEPPQSLLPSDDSSAPGSPSNLTPAQDAAITALSSTLNLPPGQITLVSTESVTWPDGCLGVQREGVMCTQALVDGYKIILEVNGQQYEMHTNEDGSTVVLATNLAVNGSIESVLTAQLANNLGLNLSDVSVVSSEAVEFPDTCLGVQMQDVMCAEAVTPGRIVVLESGGVHYEYHVNEDGSIIQPATLVLTWSRVGGIAGFCDSLTVFLSGEIYGNHCKSQPNETMGTFANLLSAEERAQFDKWVKELGRVDIDASEPKGVSDQMEIKLIFYGMGQRSLKKADEQELFLWVQNLFQKLYS